MASSRLPLIGLAPVRVRDAGGGSLLTMRPKYIEALVAAGGVPVVLGGVTPGLARDFVAGLDGVVLPGGRDIPPALYGEKPEPELEETLDDDLAETYLAVARAALELGTPLLGICLGFQVMNVARGGTLVQHLKPTERGPLHRGPGQVDVRHEVTIRPGSRLHAAVGRDKIEVVSHHHQSPRALGQGLTPTAWAADGLVEAFEQPGPGYFLGVQWHPERGLDDPASVRLFEGFVAECRRAAMDRQPGRT